MYTKIKNNAVCNGGDCIKVLVTGANGNLGSKIVEYLLTRLSIEEILVGVRDDKSEKALSYKEQGLEVRVTDFENQETLFSAYKCSRSCQSNRCKTNYLSKCYKSRRK